MTEHIYYYEDENIFTDEQGVPIFDLFRIITPQNLFMFRHDAGYNCFPIVGNKERMCEIIPVPVELVEMHEFPSIDLGDDYERIERYEKAKLHGYIF